VDEAKFDEILKKAKEKYGASYDTDLTTDHLKEISKQYLDVVKKETKSPSPWIP